MPASAQPASDSSSDDGHDSSDDGSEQKDIGPVPRVEARAAAASAVPAARSTRADVSEDEHDYADDDDAYDDDHYLPVSHEIVLQHGSNPVTALTLDPAGARLVTGDLHHEVKFWDFSGMDRSLRSFRTLTPSEGHAIHALHYNRTGEAILAISAGVRAHVFTRDAKPVLETPRGDQYLLDMTKTLGHVGEVHDGCWSASERYEFITTSADATIRFWDATMAADAKLKCHSQIIRLKDARGHKVHATALDCSADGKSVAVGCVDGTVQLYSTKVCEEMRGM
jgi:WD repeat-containing protein 70